MEVAGEGREGDRYLFASLSGRLGEPEEPDHEPDGPQVTSTLPPLPHCMPPYNPPYFFNPPIHLSPSHLCPFNFPLLSLCLSPSPCMYVPFYSFYLSPSLSSPLHSFQFLSLALSIPFHVSLTSFLFCLSSNGERERE